jgi:hypothetical protein
MGFESSIESWFQIIRQAMFQGSFLYDRGDITIMDMADVREKVVFNLEV